MIVNFKRMGASNLPRAAAAAALLFFRAGLSAQQPAPPPLDPSDHAAFQALLAEVKTKAGEEGEKKRLPPADLARLFRKRVLPAFNARTRLGLTWTSFTMLHPEKAAAVFTEEIAISSSSAEAYLKRGAVYKNMRRYDQALEDLSVSLKLDPGLEKGYASYQRALVRRQMARQAKDGAGEGNNAAALLDFEDRLRLDPADAYSYQGRGELGFEQGRLKEAAADYTRFFEFCPDKSYADLVSRGEICKELALKGLAPKGCRPKKFFEKRDRVAP